MTNAPDDPSVELDRDERFDVFLPVVGEGEPTHVARMRGDEVRFLDTLDEFVATGSELSAPLRMPVVDVGAVRFALSGLGPAEVEEIEPV